MATQHTYRIPNKATIFQAEMYEVYRAAMALENYEADQIKFYIDSQAALLALTSHLD